MRTHRKGIRPIIRVACGYLSVGQYNYPHQPSQQHNTSAYSLGSTNLRIGVQLCPRTHLAVRTFASGLTRLALSPSRTHSAVRTFASKAKTERADTACVSTAARTPGGPVSRRCCYRFHQQACGNIEIQETTTHRFIRNPRVPRDQAPEGLWSHHYPPTVISGALRQA